MCLVDGWKEVWEDGWVNGQDSQRAAYMDTLDRRTDKCAEEQVIMCVGR